MNDIREKLAATNKFWQAVQQQNYHVMGLIDQYKRREDKLVSVNTDLVQIFIGVKGCGKNALCQRILKQKRIDFAYLRFRDKGLRGLGVEELTEVLVALFSVYGDFNCLLADGIQNIDRWHLFLCRFLRQNILVLATASYAGLPCGEFSEQMAEKFRVIELFPLSFSEYCRFSGVDASDLSTFGSAMKKRGFEEYVRKGGFPELLGEREEGSYARDLFNEILFEDILQRFNVRYVRSLRGLAAFLTNSFGQELNYKSLAERFGFGSAHTAQEYVSYLKQGYLLIGIPKYYNQKMERIRCEKAYLPDPALIRNRPESAGLEYDANLLKNIICVELLRRARPLSDELCYFRNQQYEIDFVVCSGTRVKELIVVSLDISDRKNFKKGISALRRGAEELRCDKLTLIALNGASRAGELQDIRVVSAIDWLLEEY